MRNAAHVRASALCAHGRHTARALWQPHGPRTRYHIAIQEPRTGLSRRATGPAEGLSRGRVGSGQPGIWPGKRREIAGLFHGASRPVVGGVDHRSRSASSRNASGTERKTPNATERSRSPNRSDRGSRRRRDRRVTRQASPCAGTAFLVLEPKGEFQLQLRLLRQMRDRDRQKRDMLLVRVIGQRRADKLLGDLGQARGRGDRASSVTDRVTARRSAKRTRTVTVRPASDLARRRVPILSATASAGRKTRSTAGLRPSADWAYERARCCVLIFADRDPRQRRKLFARRMTEQSLERPARHLRDLADGLHADRGQARLGRDHAPHQLDGRSCRNSSSRAGSTTTSPSGLATCEAIFARCLVRATPTEIGSRAPRARGGESCARSRPARRRAVQPATSAKARRWRCARPAA